MANKTNRYIVTLELYIWDADDASAREQALALTNKVNELTPGAQAQVTELGISPFGTVGVYIPIPPTTP